MPKPYSVVRGVVLLFLCGLIVGVAWSQAPEKGRDLQDKPAPDFQNLDSIFSLIEKELPAPPPGAELFGRYRPQFDGLAKEYELKANEGDRVAQFKIGALYLEGMGVRTNFEEAARWFSKAGGPDHPLVLFANGRYYQMSHEARLNQTIRAKTIEVLGRIGPAAEAAIPLIEPDLEREYPFGSAAGKALGRMGEHGVSILMEALASKDVGRRRAAAEGLSEAGEAARPAIPQLNAALKDEDPKTREYANWALLRLKEKTK